MKSNQPDHFKVTNPIKLSEIPTHINIEVSEKKKIKALEKVGGKLSKLQDKMYAHSKYFCIKCLVQII